MIGTGWAQYSPRTHAACFAMERAGGRSALARRAVFVSMLAAAIAMSSPATAQFVVIDTFESYANDMALQAAWVAQMPLPPGNVTLTNTGISGKSMSVVYNVAGGDNAVEFTFPSNQDWTLLTTVRVLYQVQSGSNNEDIVLEIRDNMGMVLASGVAPDGTATGLKKFELDIVHNFVNRTTVRKIRLIIRDGGDGDGEGNIFFDDISVSSGNYSTCRTCHGEFLNEPYVAVTDGVTWLPDLHDVHRNLMLDMDCATCHTLPNFFPVFIGSSTGGNGLPPIGCLGCHGREEDLGHDTISPGRAAGLSQHHHLAGVTECAQCHTDADPADADPYKAVGENVLPAYYLVPDAAHPNKPTEPCGGELFVSPLEGLDNDGDQRYDLLDPDCQRAEPVPVLGSAGLVAGLALLLGFGIWRLRLRKHGER